MLLLAGLGTSAQVQISGTVYDSLGYYPVPSVSVLTSQGSGTVTDANGKYKVTVSEKDSIWFSYLNKPTRKFAVRDIAMPYAFDISLKIFIPVLPNVRVQQRNYRQDSLENRLEYQRIFDFQKPGLSTNMSRDGMAGFDLVELINAFRVTRNRNTLAFQKRLIAEEQDGYVLHRFSKALIRRLTTLTDDAMIDMFIDMYKPSYLFATQADEYTFQKYIKDSFARFEKGLMPTPMWKEGYGE
ncbi:MAG: hypothetical protein QM727_08280 [Niabella sp.]